MKLWVAVSRLRAVTIVKPPWQTMIRLRCVDVHTHIAYCRFKGLLSLIVGRFGNGKCHQSRLQIRHTNCLCPRAAALRINLG